MAWKLTNVELKQVANCELDTLHPYLACDRTPDGLIDCQHCPVGYYCGFIAEAGQKKLLEYLVAKKDIVGSYVFSGIRGEMLESMLKELEAV
jgi:hypothetical protein